MTFIEAGVSGRAAVFRRRGQGWGKWIFASSRRIRESHVDRRIRFGLRDLDERFPRQLEHRDEINDDDHHAARRIEKLGEFHEPRRLQAAQHDAHVLAHRQLLARDLP